MGTEILLLLGAIIVLLYILFSGIIVLPLRRLKNYFLQAGNKVRKDFEGMNHHDIITVKEYKLFSDNKIQKTWDNYFKVVSSGDGNHRFADIGNLFDPEIYISKKVNISLFSVIPVLFFFLSSALTVVFDLLFSGNVQTRSETVVLVIFLNLLLSALMAAIFHISRFKTVEAIDSFNLKVSEIFQTPYGTGEQISDIRMILGRYHSDQLKLYSKLNKEISLTVVQKLEPFLETMEKMVRDYLSAISTDQQKAMEHLADYFMKNTSELYDGQIEKITRATTQMTLIQEKTSGSLDNISGFFNASVAAIDKVMNSSKEMTDSYEKYLIQMKDMSMGIDANIKLMAQMLEYIDENAKNKDFTIEKLTSFQEDLIKTSQDSKDQMKAFFDEFKNTYTNHLLTMQVLTERLDKSGSIIEKSYNDFNGSLGEISGFFESLKSGMDDVRNNTNELSAVYKENLDKLESVNNLIGENIKSSSDLTEYINNSLKSNNFTVEKLAQFQKELIDISDKTNSAMNEFFTDFKDHYSSYIIAMKAASADMQKSGELLSESYSGFTSNLNSEVSEVFAGFEDNLSKVSIKFAKSITDLQEAIDELPDIIKGIK